MDKARKLRFPDKLVKFHGRNASWFTWLCPVKVRKFQRGRVFEDKDLESLAPSVRFLVLSGKISFRWCAVNVCPNIHFLILWSVISYEIVAPMSALYAPNRLLFKREGWWSWRWSEHLGSDIYFLGLRDISGSAGVLDGGDRKTISSIRLRFFRPINLAWWN